MLYFTESEPYDSLIKNALFVFWRLIPKCWIFALLSCASTLTNIFLPFRLYPWSATSIICILLILINCFAWLCMFDRLHDVFMERPDALASTIQHVAKRFGWVALTLVGIALAFFYAEKIGESVARSFLINVGTHDRMSHMAVVLFGFPMLYVSALLMYAPILVVIENQNPWKAIQLSWNYVYRKWWIGFIPCGLIYLSFGMYLGILHLLVHTKINLYEALGINAVAAMIALPFVVTATLLILNDLKMRRLAYEEKLNSRFRKKP